MLATMKAQIGDLVTADTPEGPVTGVLVHRLRSMLTLDVTDTPHADTHGRRPAWSGPTETLPAYYARQGARGRFCEVFAHNVTATERAR